MESNQPADCLPPITVALVGNPNTGKSTLFSALSGVPARIGNYPGVTVEKKIGRYRDDHGEVRLVDLPGTYSLAARTLDEKVSVDVLLGHQADVPIVDVVVAIVDATNLERNLYLFSQLQELGKPIVLVLNMWDQVLADKICIDVAQLRSRLGAEVVTCSARRKEGLEELQKAVRRVANSQTTRPCVLGEEMRNEVEQLADWIRDTSGKPIEPFSAQRMVLDMGGAIEEDWQGKPGCEGLPDRLAEIRNRLEQAGLRVPAVETRLRYKWIRAQLDGIHELPDTQTGTFSDHIDHVLTHRVWGMLAFALLMFVVFQSITWGTGGAMELITDHLQPWFTSSVEGVIAPGTLRSLINDGIIAGVGSVIVFLPQILMLFFFIGMLEDCGYMARAAFVMDKSMTRLGLSGKSFLPLMSSFACAVPGIMAARVIENRRDRLVTILVAPLMSCSARLPVYVLLIYTFVPEQSWLGGWVGLRGSVLFGMHLVGVLVAIPVAWLLKRFFFPGETSPFVLELPSYKFPSPRVVFDRVWERAQAFLTRAGTLIFCTSILVWAAAYFPGDHSQLHAITAQIETLQALEEDALEEDAREEDAREQEPNDETAAEAESEQDDNALDPAETTELANLLAEHRKLSGSLIEDSLLGRAGKSIEPIVQPLGWDWRIGVGVIASFPAREVIIATLGTIYSLGGDVDEGDEGLQSAIRSSRWPDGRPVYTLPVALSIMVFFALCAQCAATLMVIKRETNSWRWPIFTFAYMTGLAYVAALLTYQIGSRLI